MPFGEESSNSYGTGAGTSTSSSSSMKSSSSYTKSQDAPFASHSQQSSVPLRRSRGSSSFVHPQSSFEDFPYPPYSELPFPSQRRRKQRQRGSELVKWTMRGVLLSPVIVLVIWSIGALLFSSKVHSNTVTGSGGTASVSAASMRKSNARRNSNNSSSNNNNVMMSAPQQQQVYPGYLQPYRMSPDQQQQMQMQQQQQQMQQLQYPLQGQAYYAMPQANMAVPQYNMMPQQQQQPQQLQMPPVMPALGATNEAVAAPAAMQGVVVQPPTLSAAAEVVGQQQQQQAEPAPLQQQQQPLQSTPKEAAAPAAVLYYDPKQAINEQTGQLQLPSTVYDAQGNPIDLASLAGKQILMGAPAAKGEAPVQEPLETMQAPKAQMSLSDIQAPAIPQWGESTTQEQTITLSTVAVMALLVGALSARRMRARSVLSSCIENEAMEDEVAYDAAYTTTNEYNTFGGGGGWKGDLEKFDV